LPAPAQLAGQVEQVVFAPFGSSHSVAYGSSSVDPAPVLRASPYGSAYALALRLRRAAATPYAYVRAVKRYLSSGFTYSENPAPAAYPLETFLFKTRAGYCQQFAGAMALLLRMGGVPARVGVGFTSGSYDKATRRWVVSDIDAHAWVEAWFPRYGWVRFDPTPAAAPALGGRSTVPGDGGAGSGQTTKQPSSRGHGGAGGGRVASRAAGHGSGSPGGGEVAIVVAILAALLATAYVLTRPLAPGDPQLEELERAFTRAARPLGAGTTLLELERRLDTSPEAAGYVRELRIARFVEGAGEPSRRQRRALRAQLRMGLGPLGRARALWALPPRRDRRGGA
ncbi:MAG TPA: transglutaminase-like domain-containing protein, partial [Solirubrobacteraceae bacterium]